MAPRGKGAACLSMPCFLARLVVRWEGISLQSWVRMGNFALAGLRLVIRAIVSGIARQPP